MLGIIIMSNSNVEWQGIRQREPMSGWKEVCGVKKYAIGL